MNWLVEFASEQVLDISEGGWWVGMFRMEDPRIFHFLYLHFLMNTMKRLDLLRTIMNAPRKINMEPDKTPLEEENHLNQTIIFGFYVKLRGEVTVHHLS